MFTSARKAELVATRDVAVKVSKEMHGSECPQFRRIHHNFHHLVLFIKDYIMKGECKNYLEIGTHYGHSLCSMLQSEYPTRYLAIDLFKRWADGTIDDFEEVVRQNVVKFNRHGHDVRVVRGRSTDQGTIQEVKSYFSDGIDLLFIDGDHSYKGIVSDFDAYFPLLNEGAYIVFDDYLPFKVRGKERGAPKAVDHIVKQYGERLAVIGLVDDIAEAYKAKPCQVDPNGKNIEYVVRKV